MSARAVWFWRGCQWGGGAAERGSARHVVALALCCAALVAGGARADRRERSRPMLVAAASAPTATVWQLRFAEVNGRLTLFAGGADKFVRTWTIDETGGNVRLTEAAKVSWSVYREQVGAINALDVASDGQGTRLAFGGFGRKASQLNLLYAEDPDQAVSLLDRDLLDPSQVVKSLDLHHDRAENCCWLAVAHEGKNYVPIWKVSRGDAEGSTNEPAGKVQVAALRGGTQVAFRGDGAQLAVAGPKRAGGFAVMIYDVSDKTAFSRATLAAQQDTSGVTSLAWCGEALVVGTEQGFSVLGDSSGLAATEGLPAERVHALTALGTSSVVVASSNKEQANPEAGHNVRVIDLTRGTTQLLSSPVPFIEALTAVSASADGQWIAATGLVREALGDGEPPVPVLQIGLWKKAPDGTYRRVASIPDGKDAQQIVAPIAKVAVGRDEAQQTIVGFTWGTWDRRPERQVKRGYNLAAGAIVPWMLGQPAHEDWKIQGKRTAEGLVFHAIQKRDNSEWAGPIDGFDKGFPRCYTWVPHGGRYVLAVGYDRGILVWDWDKLQRLTASPPKDTSLAILRSFYGHTQQVNCLAAAADGSWLVSGSQDGTICAWSLKDLPAAGPGGEMGVVLRWDGRRYLVDGEPAPGSPALEAGFTKGQAISRFIVRGKALASLDGVLEPRGGNRYRFNTPPGDAVEVDAAAPGQSAQRLLSRCSRDPLWTFYPLRNGEWYVHTPEGFYAKSAPAVEINWLVNQSGSQDIEVERGGALERRLGASLLQPEVIFRETLSLDRLAETAEGTDGARGRPTLVADFLASATPIDTFLAAQRLPNPLAGRPSRPAFRYSVREDGRGGLAVQVAADAGTDKLTRLELRLNGWRLTGQKRVDATGVEAAVTPDMLRAAGVNELIAVATITALDPATGKPRPYHFPDFYRLRLPASAERPKPTVHFLGIGNGFVFEMRNGKRAEVPGHALPDCAGDVEKMRQALDAVMPAASGRTYRKCLLDRDKTAVKPAFRASMRELAEQVRPDDLVVIMLAGHGCLDAAGGAASAKAFTYLAYDALIEPGSTLAPACDQSGASTGITGEELASWLAELNCRTCLVLDTCHSGAAPTAQQLDDQASLSIGPIVVAACGRQEKSFAHKDLGGGLFTAAMVKAWELKKANPRLTLGEWLRAVPVQCEALRKKYLRPSERQSPQIVPSRTFLGYENFTLE